MQNKKKRHIPSYRSGNHWQIPIDLVNNNKTHLPTIKEIEEAIPKDPRDDIFNIFKVLLITISNN